jgi:parallel beta-helix repeat protein
VDTSVDPLGVNDVIRFHIGAGLQVIQVSGTPIDDLTNPVTIDGTAPGDLPDQQIDVDGSLLLAAATPGNGVTVKKTDTIKNMEYSNYLGFGIWVQATAGGSTIAGNTVANNTKDGIRIDSNGNTIQGNSIDYNGGNGISLNSAKNNTIGGSRDLRTGSAGNEIIGNSGDGILITATNQGAADNNKIQGNNVGIASGGFLEGLIVVGGQKTGNRANGVEIAGTAASTTIGGATSDLRNVISANAKDGILLRSTGG